MIFHGYVSHNQMVHPIHGYAMVNYWRLSHRRKKPGRQEFLLNGSPPNTELSQTPLPTTQLRWRPHAAASKTQSVAWDGRGDRWKVGKKLGKSRWNLGKSWNISVKSREIMEHLGEI